MKAAVTTTVRAKEPMSVLIRFLDNLDVLTLDDNTRGHQLGPFVRDVWVRRRSCPTTSSALDTEREEIGKDEDDGEGSWGERAVEPAEYRKLVALI